MRKYLPYPKKKFENLAIFAKQGQSDQIDQSTASDIQNCNSGNSTTSRINSFYIEFDGKWT